jgi:quercetin dioxygenase-like cupin family protein
MHRLSRLLTGLGPLKAMPDDGSCCGMPPAPPLASLPLERVGISGNVIAKVDLSADFDVSRGRQLRMREVTIAPGGFLPMHSHADRPAVAYVLQGTMTEYLDGQDEPVVVEAGQAYSSHRRPHALLNLGDVPVVFLEIDLF